MTENCRDCPQIKSAQDNIKRLNSESVDYEKRITQLERRVDVGDERFKQVFKKLDEIIDILRKHEEADRERSSRLPTFMWTVGGMVLGGIVVGVIMWFLQSVI